MEIQKNNNIQDTTESVELIIRDIEKIDWNKERGKELLAEAQSMDIQSSEDMEVAYVYKKTIDSIIKDEGDVIFSPLKSLANKLHKTICAREKEFRKPYEDAKVILSKKIGEYQAAERRRIEEETARKIEEAKKENPDKPIVIEKEQEHKIAGMSVQTYWKFEIEDVAKIPREYLMPDMSKIGQEVRKRKGDTKIEGVRVYAETKAK